MVSGFGGRGVGGVVGPGLGCSPEAGGGEVDAEGTGGAVGGQDFGKAVTNLRKGGRKGVEPGDGGHAGEVQGVAGGVEVAFEGCGVSAAEGKCHGSETETARRRGGGWLFLVVKVGHWRCDGLDGHVSGDE